MLLEDDTRLPSFTLRKHTDGVTALCIVRVPLATTTALITDNQESPMLHKPYLISGDDKGLLILWDLTTRRPVTLWQGHQSSVITIQQMGLDKGIVSDKFYGLVFSHGRDNSVKFWRLFDQLGHFDCTRVYDLPENALNFCNVDHYGNLLVTPNTLESSKFDIYDLDFLGDDNINENRLKRIYEGVDIYQTAVSHGYDFKEFRIQRDEDETSRVDKFGIIMKVLFIRRNLLAIGYESGHVAIVELDFDNHSHEILSISAENFPNPVLSLSYDSLNNVIASTSIRSQIVLHDIASLTNKTIKLDKFGKLGAICNINEKYIISSWNGTTKFFTLSDDKLEYQSSFTKPKGMISGDLNINGNLQDNERKRQAVVKPNVLGVADSTNVPTEYGIGRRDLALIQSRLLCTGYSDGTISVYTDF